MSIYHAFADRSPVLIFCGNTLDAANRRAYVEWVHAAQDNAAMVRDILKWDDQPVSLTHFAESTVRGYRPATNAPRSEERQVGKECVSKRSTRGAQLNKKKK